MDFLGSEIKIYGVLFALVIKCTEFLTLKVLLISCVHFDGVFRLIVIRESIKLRSLQSFEFTVTTLIQLILRFFYLIFGFPARRLFFQFVLHLFSVVFIGSFLFLLLIFYGYSC